MARKPRDAAAPGQPIVKPILNVAATQPLTAAGRTTGPGLIDRVTQTPGVFVPLAPDFTRNLYEASRPGHVIVRPEDLLALRIELRNLTVTPGTPPKLRKSGAGAAYLTLHFPPQAIAEQTFFLTPPPNLVPNGTQQGQIDAQSNPYGTPKSEPRRRAERGAAKVPPVRARIADESRLVFAVPDGFEIDYTLAAILDAVQTLTPSVAANAKPRGTSRRVVKASDLFNTEAINTLSPKARAGLATYTLRSLRIGALQGDQATLRLRQATGGPAFQPLGKAALSVAEVNAAFRPVAQPARPAVPGPTTTAIELPWRLILSPHSGTRWQHASSPAHSDATKHTELWHSRLTAPAADGSVIPSPYPDRNRTTRAIWARSGEALEAATPPMQSQWPSSADIPLPVESPFRTPMDDSDRFQISHLSSNFSLKGYEPAPVDTNLMMLTALGGWLNSRGAWEPPGLSVEEWVHRATMARDHYVRIVYRGFLFPFGHRVSLVKVSERRFHNGQQGTEKRDGNPAYLRQRMFIVVREHERTYDDPGFLTAHSKDSSVVYSHAFPFSRIKILTQVTPDIDDPATPPSSIHGRLMFWPYVGGAPFRFQCSGTDIDGNRVIFDLPMIFIDNIQACPRTYNKIKKTVTLGYAEAEGFAATARDKYDAASDRNWADLTLQRVALATSVKPGDTQLQVERMTFGGFVEDNNTSIRALSDGLNRPVFLPRVAETQARIAALSHLTGSAKSNRLQWNAHYLQFGFDSNEGEVFADVMQDAGMAQLDFSSQGDRSGGFVQPNMKPKALSRLAGPVTSDVDKFIDGNMPKGSGFPTSISDLPLPLLFGCIPLGELIEAVASLSSNPEKIPKFGSEVGQ